MMKIFIITIILTLLTIELYSQSPEVITITNKGSLNGKVYNKVTGEKLSDEELVEVLQKHPNIIFEKVINEYGEISNFYFDPNNIKNDTGSRTIIRRSAENQVKEGESFPDFIFKTIEKETIKSKNLKGTWILLRFELFARFTNKPLILDLSNQLKDLEEDYKIIPIICFADSEQNIKNELDIADLVFRLVADGSNFHEKYSIIKFPTTIIIDDQGRVYKYFFNNENIDFSGIWQN